MHFLHNVHAVQRLVDHDVLKRSEGQLWEYLEKELVQLHDKARLIKIAASEMLDSLNAGLEEVRERRKRPHPQQWYTDLFQSFKGFEKGEIDRNTAIKSFRSAASQINIHRNGSFYSEDLREAFRLELELERLSREMREDMSCRLTGLVLGNVNEDSCRIGPFLRSLSVVSRGEASQRYYYYTQEEDRR